MKGNNSFVSKLSLEREWKERASDVEGEVKGDFLQWEGEDGTMDG
jgi:hypothetical protein